MSQNELQRVVAEIRGRMSAYPAGIRNELANWLRRIEAAQAVAPGGVPDGWMRDKDQVTKLAEHLESFGWRQNERGDVECHDQGAAMAAEVVRNVLLPMLAAAPASEAKGINGEALVERLEMLVVALKAEASVGRRGYNFGEDAANARAGSIAEEIEKAVHEVRVLGTSHPRTAEEAHRCKGASEPKPAASSAADDAELPGMWSHSDFTGGATDAAEQEQAGELPELPEPVSSVAIAAWGPKPDYYTADQMHALYRKGYDAALLRRAARVEVTDAMVDRVAEVLIPPGATRIRICEAYNLARRVIAAALEPKE